MTLRQLAETLSAAGIESARTEALLLIEHVTGKSAASILADAAGLTPADYTDPRLDDLVRRRAERYPLQYLLGKWTFCGLPFEVGEACLIPRPDTECIAERAIAELPENGRLLDLCTGSGCIAAAVLTYTKHTTAAAVELCPETADLARRNLEALGLSDRCTVLTGDASDDLLPPEALFDVITMNPPYIAKEEMPSLEPELSFEPRIALTDEADGLSLYRRVLPVWSRHLKPGGCILLEHGYRQAHAVRAIAEACGFTAETIRDLGGCDRGQLLRRP